MKGVTFGNLHSYRDLKLIMLEGKEIGSPDVKENKIEIEGADSDLDLTEFFGEPKYKDMPHKFPFSFAGPIGDFLSQYSQIKNAIHGKKLKIILDDDPAFFYVGRIRVLPATTVRNIGYVTIETICEPYKYKINPTVVTRAITGSTDITLTNSRKRAVPTITTTATMTFAFGEGSWTVGTGSFTIPELELVEGDNIVTVTGTGNVTFTWEEGSL